MKKLTKPIVVFLFAMIAVIGCKRESLPENSAKNKEQVTGAVKTPSAPADLNYRATEADIAAAKNAWLTKARSEKSNIRSRGGCGEHISDFIYVVNATGGCSSGLWTTDYYIFSYDYVGSGYEETPVSASFTDMYFGFPISATLISSGSSLVDPDCKEWQWDGYCEMVRYYHYQLTNMPAPTSAWPSDVGNFSLDLLSGFSTNCTPITVSGDLKGGFTAAEYASMAARVYVSNFGVASINVFTDCSILCPPPYVQCPTGGTFQYWPLGSPPGTTVSIPWNGMQLGPLNSGPYQYSAVLTYNIGGTVTTLPLTGSFSIP